MAASSSQFMALGQAAKSSSLPDFDARSLAVAARSAGGVQAKTLVDQRLAKMTAFAATSSSAAGVRIVPNRLGLPKSFIREGSPLTAASAEAPEAIARNFIRANSTFFPFAPDEVDRLRLTLSNSTGSATFLAFTQTIGGIDVFEGQIKLTLSQKGEVIMAGAAEVIPGVSIPVSPRLSAEDAVAAAFRSSKGPEPAALTPMPTTNGRTLFANPAGAGFAPVTTELSVFPLTASSARLAYRIFLQIDNLHYYEILVDAENGTLLYRHNLVKKAAQARVWTNSPLVGTRVLVNLPSGWLPPAGTVTTGNNVDGYLDSNGDGAPDNINTGGLSQGRASSPARVFDFPFGDGTTGQNPRSFPAAAVTNLFYFVNVAHDYYYSLGFTETAANFQTDNFGLGGLGNDPILAQSQCGDAVNNAYSIPVPEGIPGRICMGIFTQGTQSLNDDVDSDYEGEIVLHEYGHGMSTRLVGAGTSTSCLDGLQSGAMSEGWSDYFASSFFNNPIEGAYVVQAPAGIRRHSYEGYPFTYEDVGNSGYEEHDDGEIWAATLWDLRNTLGQQVADLLVVNGLKATVCSPSMIDARDAILAADQATNGGANRAAIWAVFARHGMGFSAAGVDGDAITGTRYDANYDQPPDLQAQKSPAITSDPLAIFTMMGSAYNYPVTATNPNGGTLNYALTVSPTGMTLGAASGITNWTASFNLQRVKITVTDGQGGRVIHGYLLPILTPLTLDAPITIASLGDLPGFAFVAVPPSYPTLQVTLRGGLGDADMYVVGPDAYGISVQYDSNETVTFPLPAAGFWIVEVDRYLPYSGVALKASAVTPTPIPANGSLAPASDVISSERLYKLTIPPTAGPAATSLKVSISGGSGNADLLLKLGSPAACQFDLGFVSTCSYDIASQLGGNVDSITIPNPPAGDYYIDLYGAAAYSGVILTTQVVTPPAPDLTIAKTHTGNFFTGQTGALYTLTVKNVGAAPTTGPITVTDILPASLTLSALSGNGWTCTAGTASCTRTDSLATNGSFPPILLTVNVAANAPASVTNMATVDGGGENDKTNDTASDPTTITEPPPDLKIEKHHISDFVAGLQGVYSLIVTNIGPTPTTGSVQVTDTPPSQFGITSIAGAGWICNQPAGPCVRTDSLAPGASYPAISVTGIVPLNVIDPFTNFAGVQGGGDTNAANNTAGDLTVVRPSIDCPPYPESPHPYPNNFDRTWTCTALTGASLDVTFDAQTSVEPGLDFIYITDGNGNPIPGSPFTGASLAGQTKNVPGTVLKIRLVSDRRNGDYGFKVTNVVIRQATLDVGIAKSHNGTFTQGQTGATYSLIVTNTGGAATSGVISVSDVVPAGLTATAISGTGWTCTQPAGPCTRNDSLAPAASYPPITVTVNVAANAPASVTNTATVSAAGDVNSANNTANDPTTIVSQAADLTITKTHAGNFALGQVGATYTIAVKNSGNMATTGTVSVIDTVPNGLTATTISGTGWSCTQPAGPCTRADSLSPGASYPPISVAVTVAGNAPASVTNIATISGGGDSNGSNNSASDPTTIDMPLPGCVLESAHPYSSNTDFTWTCTLPGNPAALDVTFDARTSVEAGADFLYITDGNGVGIAGSPFTGTQLVGQTKHIPGSTVKIHLVSDRRNEDFGFKVTSIVPTGGTAPDLRIIKTHTGNFTVGQLSASYTLLVDNAGNGPSSGMVTVTDTIPAGLTPLSISGTGWLCTQPAGPCNRSDVLAPGSAYPVITLTVSVAPNAPGTVTNTASVTGGGDSNPANNTAVDPTNISPSLTPDLTITKMHNGSFFQGQANATYTLTVKNAGSAASFGAVSVADIAPNGLTILSMAGSGWTCNAPAGPCTRSDSLPPGSSYQPITVTVKVSATAPASVTNTATVSGGGDTNTANNTASDPTVVNSGQNACIFPESTHPYDDNLDYTWTCTLPANVTSMNVTFDVRTSVEPGADFIYVTDGNGVNIPGSPFTGAMLAAQTKLVPGNVLKIQLVTNRRNNDFGFKVTDIVGDTGGILQ